MDKQLVECGGGLSMPQMPKPWEPTEQDIATMAQLAHELNRTYCATQGDLSQPSWADAPDWQQQSAIAGVKYHLEHPGASGRDSHDQWLEVKLKDGWRYGPTKDPQAKTHPCCLPYHALPANQKIKDDLFKAIINGYRTFKRQQQ